MAGLTYDLKLGLEGVEISTELSALFGGHLDLTVTRATDSQTSFSIVSRAAPEGRSGTSAPTGGRSRSPERWMPIAT